MLTSFWVTTLEGLPQSQRRKNNEHKGFLLNKAGKYQKRLPHRFYHKDNEEKTRNTRDSF